MRQRLLYVYEERVPQGVRQIVLDAFPPGEFELDSMTYLTPAEDQKRKLAWADVVFFAPGRHLPDEVLSAARSVKLMQLWSSGYDKFNLAGATALGIPVANNHGANAASVAEHSVMLMLSVAKRLPDSHRRAVTGAWSGNSHGLDMFTLRGKVVGIVGFGNIGRRVAAILLGFGARVLFYDPREIPAAEIGNLEVAAASFDDLLARSDIVTLHTHGNARTANLLGPREFARLTKGAVLINTSRASLVDQDALYEALRDGTLAGAGLDVYPVEPTVADDRILSLPQVVATPHMAGSTRDAYRATMEFAVENFRRVARGETPLGLVSPPG